MAGIHAVFGGRPGKSRGRDGLKVAGECSLHQGVVSPATSKGIRMDSFSPIVNGKLSTHSNPGLGEEGNKFDPLKVEKIIKDYLDAYLYNTKYEADMCARLGCDICRLIRDRVKELGYPRYRLVSHVLVGQDSDQGLHMAARCFWDQRSDNFAAASYRNSSIFAVGIVYGIYLETKT